MSKRRVPEDFDDNTEWSREDFARARLASEVHPPHVVRALVRKPGRPVGWTKPDAKQQIALRLDSDVIEKFKSGGPGWQTRMNEAPRAAAGL